MRSSITGTVLPRTIILTSLIAVVPLAGAYASVDSRGHAGALDQPAPTVFQGPRVEGILDQIQGVSEGIADAEQANKITPAEARGMKRRADRIGNAAERMAENDHGRIPLVQYRHLLHRVDGLAQSLKAGNGMAVQFGNGGDG